MKILIVYGTTEGQTRKIAWFVRDHLAEAGHQVRLIETSDDIDVDPLSFDKVIIAASLHTGDYQPAVCRFASTHRETLNRIGAVFLSVSLAAAGTDADDVEGLRACVDRFAEDTGWTPAHVEHVAGAFRFTQYDFLKRWAMKYISWQKGQPTDTTQDYELTNWEKLEHFVDGLATPVAGCSSLAS
jgi:menaquinone-dependent protoporphyrinogen oxidase